jgi:cyclophilin family peptidyl-prolyl cis-trans isomerase
MLKRIHNLSWAILLAVAMLLAIPTNGAFLNMDRANAATTNPVVMMETSAGNIKIELFADKAPKSVENFLWYVDHDFYNGLTFHRVIDGFMIQGGGFTPDMVRKSTNPPIVNEAENGVKNDRGTLAMARTSEVNSATSQFFINLKDNAFLDFKNKTPQGYGYAVFGKVIDGMDTVDKIAKVKTISKAGNNDVPATPVVITKVIRVESKKEAKKETTEKKSE